MTQMNRRTFAQTVALGLGAAALPVWAQGKKTLKIAYTNTTWPSFKGPATTPGGPRPILPDAVEAFFKDVSSLGFYAAELHGDEIEGMESRGGVGQLIEKYNLPLIASYSSPNLIDPAAKQETIQGLVANATLVKKYGVKIMVIAPNNVDRATYVFADHKANIIATLNEAAKAIADLGLTTALHQHTGTAVETRDETYAVMEAVDTRYLKFSPDVGQLQKGGADPVQVVKDFLPITHHMHLKDYVGGAEYAGYCPLGQGKVNLSAILDMMEGHPMNGMIVVELDKSPNMPLTALETAKIAKAYLQTQGVTFRS